MHLRIKAEELPGGTVLQELLKLVKNLENAHFWKDLMKCFISK